MFKTTSAILALSGIIVSAGAEARSTRRQVPAPAVIVNVTVAPTNGGINPEFFAYEIEGQILLGSNSCVAAGRTAELKIQEQGDLLTVTPIIKSAPVGPEPRIRTAEYDPVFAYVAATVRGDSREIRDIIVHNVNAAGHDVSALLLFALATQPGEEIVLSSVIAEPTNGGINPDAFAVKLSAVVLKGGNPCEAANTDVRLEETQVGTELRVKAVKRQIQQGIGCTREWDPVYVPVTTTVRGMASEVSAVIVENVDALGNDVDASQLF